MATIATVMPTRTLDRAMGPAQRARLAGLARPGRHLQVENLEALVRAADCGEVEIILTGWGSPRLTPALLKDCPKLKLVAHCMGTVRGIVDPALFEHGVRCTTAAAPNAVPVAEFVLSWILRWNKRLPYWEARYREQGGAFDMAERFSAEHAKIGNLGKTVGVIGASRVGRKLLELLTAFDLTALLFDPYLNAAEAKALGAEKVELAGLVGGSDVVSINAPLLPETRHLIGAAELAAMREGALLINTARGGLIDHEALVAELATGRISAVLDVTEPEPLPADSPLFGLANVFVTPHVAGSMGTEIYRMTESALDEVELYLKEKRLRHEVSQQSFATAA